MSSSNPIRGISTQRGDGKRESYNIVQFVRGEDTVELFIYVNEAGIMVNANDWTIFEAPDFESEEELIEAYAQHLRTLLSPGANRNLDSRRK
jgi:hypothetical protein